MFNLKKAEPELTAVLESLKGGFRGDGADFFSERHHERMRSNRHGLLQGKF